MTFFVLRDHLGSSRVVLHDRYFDKRDYGYVYTSGGGGGLFGTGSYLPQPIYTILQVNDYYPFGLNHEHQAAAQDKDFQYEYTGKERVKEVGLDWQDYGARWYDAALGRWSVVDPLASSMPSYSPYAYVFNNPISFTDPTGMVGECVMCGGSGGSYQSSTSSNEGFQQIKEVNHREMADAAARSKIQSWIKNIDIHNPYGGEEIYRSSSESQVDIVYAGAKQRASGEQVRNLASILSRQYGGAGLVAGALSVAGEVKASDYFGTWLTQNGRGFAPASFAGNEHFTRARGWSSLKAAKVSSNLFSNFSGAVTAASLAVSSADYFQNDRSFTGGVRLSAEGGVGAYSTFGGVPGVAVGVGWEMGRGVTKLPRYQRWRNETWMPWRYQNLGY